MKENSHLNIKCNTEEIKTGKSNEGIFKHKIFLPETNISFSVVEKRLKKNSFYKNEFKICEKIYLHNQAHTPMNPLPRFISVSYNNEYYYLIMPFYEGIGVQLSDFKKQGRLIAHAVAELNATFIDMPAQSQTEKLLNHTKKMILNHSKYTEFSNLVFKVFEEHFFEGFGDDVVKSHNDLYFPNISTQSCGEFTNIIFIDLGHMGYNHIGADFHHFLRAAKINACSTEMVDTMLEEYSLLVGKDKVLISINAHRFLLLRLLGRLRGFIKNNDGKRFKLELDTGNDLLSSTKDLQRKFKIR